MKIFFDTEFIEDGRTIDLISIGMKRDDGQELYMVSSEFDASKASDWVWDNVLNKIPDNFPRHPRSEIASTIRLFVGKSPKFWAYFADYDWVALCQLYGTMMNLPDGWPQYCRDLKQVIDQRGIGDIQPKCEDEHNAMSDARWVHDRWKDLYPLGNPVGGT